MPNRRCVWAPAARGDLKDIWRYVAEDASDVSADNVLHKIHGAVGKLDRTGTPGRARDELMPGLRLAVASPYIIFLGLDRDRIEIVRVLHERRDASALLEPKKSR